MRKSKANKKFRISYGSGIGKQIKLFYFGFCCKGINWCSVFKIVNSSFVAVDLGRKLKQQTELKNI